MRRRRFARSVAVLAALLGVTAGLPTAAGADELDPIRRAGLFCGNVPRPVPGAPGRSESPGREIPHLAYRCEIAGTDMEFQSRVDANGKVHDYAFVGTIGAGFQIFDITDRANPQFAGASNITGYQNDPVVRGDIAIQGYDGAQGEDSTGSACLKRIPTAQGQGFDVLRLNFDPQRAVTNAPGNPAFQPQHITCVGNPPGGTHTATIHPSGDYIVSSNPGDRAIDFIDLRGIDEPGRYTFDKRPKILYRLIDNTNYPQGSATSNTRCPANAEFTCIVARDPKGDAATGLNASGAVVKGCTTNLTGSPPPPVGAPPPQEQFCFRPHDVFFSADGNTIYCACLNSTFIIDVTKALQPGLKNADNPFPTISIIQNRADPPGRPDSPNNVVLSHGADTTPDGKILVVGDERGGGVQETGCNTGSDIIGALHFYALAPIEGRPGTNDATPANPDKLGVYVNPRPTFAPDEFRFERGCTVHVFRIGGNGAGSPGEGANRGLAGVSGLDSRQLTTAWYGAGVWYMDFSAPPDSAPKCTDNPAAGCDDIAEDDNTTWGNTLGWNIQPGADTWSAKEYKGGIFAGDLARGFDTYGIKAKRYGIDSPPPVLPPGGGGTPERVPPTVSLTSPWLATSQGRFGEFFLNLGGSDRESGLASFRVEFRDLGPQGGSRARGDRPPTGPWQTMRSATLQRRLRFQGTPGRTYQFRVRATDRAGNRSGFVTSNTLVPLDRRRSATCCVGRWANLFSPNSYFQHRLANTTGGLMRHDYRGEHFYLIGRKSPQGGRALITFDGRSRVIDFYAPRVIERTVVYGTRAAPGRHTVRLRVLRQKRRASRGVEVNADAIGVYRRGR